MMKKVNSTSDFKKYDVLYSATRGTLYKCTTGNYIKPFERSTGSGTQVFESHVRAWGLYNMGPLDDLMSLLVAKACKDIEDGNYEG